MTLRLSLAKWTLWSYKIAKLQGYIYDHLEVDENGAARVILSQEILKQFNVTDAETAAIVGAPGRIDGVSLWGNFVDRLLATTAFAYAVKFILSMKLPKNMMVEAIL